MFSTKSQHLVTSWTIYCSGVNNRLIRRFAVNRIKFIAERGRKRGINLNRTNSAKQTEEVYVVSMNGDD